LEGAVYKPRKRIGPPLLTALVALLLTGAAQAQKQSVVVEGHGETKAGAEQEALEQAREWVIGLLRERRPDIERLPDAASLRNPNLSAFIDHDPKYPSDTLGPHHRVTLRVEVGEADLQKMLQQDQQERVHRRQLWTGKGLLVVVALLAALALFFRLEEATRGYYSGPLKAGLVLALGGVAAGTWFLL